MKPSTAVFLPLAAMSTSACVPVPVHKTLQPAATITVVNQKGEPIPEAEVTLISNTHPYGWEKGRETKKTKVNGTAAFSPLQEWRTESFMLHGSEVFFWNWCVRKDGCATYFTQYGNAHEFQDNPTVRLEPGDSTPCLKSFQ